MKRAMIIAPFDASGSRIRDTVSRVLEELDIVPVRANNVAAGSSLTDSIIKSIDSADFVIADISRKNPSVMYELGYAHSLRKPTIIMMDESESSSVPSVLDGYLYIEYNSDNLSDLRDQIRRQIKRRIKNNS